MNDGQSSYARSKITKSLAVTRPSFLLFKEFLYPRILTFISPFDQNCHILFSAKFFSAQVSQEARNRLFQLAPHRRLVLLIGNRLLIVTRRLWNIQNPALKLWRRWIKENFSILLTNGHEYTVCVYLLPL